MICMYLTYTYCIGLSQKNLWDVRHDVDLELVLIPSSCICLLQLRTYIVVNYHPEKPLH